MEETEKRKSKDPENQHGNSADYHPSFVIAFPTSESEVFSDKVLVANRPALEEVKDN